MLGMRDVVLLISLFAAIEVGMFLGRRALTRTLGEDGDSSRREKER